MRITQATVLPQQSIQSHKNMHINSQLVKNNNQIILNQQHTSARAALKPNIVMNQPITYQPI